MPTKIKDNNFFIKIDKWYLGFSPTWMKGDTASFGNQGGHASAMKNVNILNPEYITQGQGVSSLTGNPSVLIKFIMDRAITDDVSYALSDTKLYQLSSSSITLKRTITGATRGESLAYLKGYLFYFWQTNIGRFDLSSTYDDDWGQNGVGTGGAELQDAQHPNCTKEDLMVFGNGKYVGYYDQSADTLYPTKLDFGNNTECVDVLFANNKWYLAINTANADDNNRGIGQIYIWDGSAVSALLEDEISLGVQKIGFMKVINGIIFVALQDLSTDGGYKIGYISGNQIKTLVRFTGSLPNFRQKTLYDNVLLFLSNKLIYAAGSIIDELPFSLSQISSGKYSSEVGAIAAPFGDILISSSDGSNYDISKFSGYTVDCNWKSLIMPLINGSQVGYIDKIVVLTNHLGTDAKCELTVYYNQQQTNSGSKNIITAGKRRHIIPINSGRVEDIQIYLDWTNGNITNPCSIREIQILGHWVES